MHWLYWVSLQCYSLDHASVKIYQFLHQDILLSLVDNTVINICKESGIDVDARDIEGCHRLPLSRNRRAHDKRVIVNFVNRKCAEAFCIYRQIYLIFSLRSHFYNFPAKTYCYFPAAADASFLHCPLTAIYWWLPFQDTKMASNEEM